MKAAIREILQYVLDHSEIATEAAVVSYFDRFLWSAEKEEWEKLTAQEKRQFIDRLDAVKGRPQKGASMGRLQAFKVDACNLGERSGVFMGS